MKRVVMVPLESKFDARLLTWGVFGGLDGFMSSQQWEQACVSGVVDGEVVGLPMTLPITEAEAEKMAEGELVDLADPTGMVFATLEVGGVFKVDSLFEAKQSLESVDPCHPWRERLEAWGPWRVFGRLSNFRGDLGADPFKRGASPDQAKARALSLGWSGFAAMLARGPLHGAHLDILNRSLRVEGIDGVVVHYAMGRSTQGGDGRNVDPRCYEAAVSCLPSRRSMLLYAPLARRMAGPREALWHARICKGFGANAVILGRDPAGHGRDSNGRPFYDPQAAVDLVRTHADALGMRVLAYQESVYSKKKARFEQPHELEWGDETLSLSGEEACSILSRGERLPVWFAPMVMREALESRPMGGVSVMLTGLSAAGKSTLAQRLAQRWEMVHGKPMTILDGDEARKMLSSELGFSREHRELNVRRLGYVASEVSKHGGASVIAAIAPFEASRQESMKMMARSGVACLVHVSTSLRTCEERDPKGLYAKARAGELRGFTGLDDPYETPSNPDLRLDMGMLGLDEACESIEMLVASKQRA